MYDVFISFKKSTKVNERVKKTDDYYMAERLNDELKGLGLSPFFSDENLKSEGTGDYKNSIVQAINSSKLFISVASRREYFESTWVKSEWDQYDNLMREGKKESNSMFVLGGEDLLANRPDELAGKEILTDIDELVEFIRNRVCNKKDENLNDNSQINSSYSFTSNEEKRLVEQARVEAIYDIKYFKKNLTDNSRTYNILDVGCSTGIVSKLVFGKLENENININLLGVDRNIDCVNKFNEQTPDSMNAGQIDFNNENWQDELVILSKKNNIDKFDVVYCALSLHHFADSGESFIKNIHKFIKDNGLIYIRSFDDCLSICYPKYDLMQKIIDDSAKCPGMSDRFHARKIYDYLFKGKYDNIKFAHHYIDTIGKDIQQRDMIYDSAFAFRINYYERYLNKVKESKKITDIEKAQKNYNEMEKMLKEMKDSILNLSHYYGYFVTIVTARKPSEFVLDDNDDIEI